MGHNLCWPVLSESKDRSYWWNLGTPLHAGKVAEHQNNQRIQYNHTEEIQVINLWTKLLITIFWDNIWATHVDFLPSVTTVNANVTLIFIKETSGRIYLQE